MSAFERVLQGVKQVLLVAEDVKQLSQTVRTLGIEVRDIDRRLARLEGVVAATAARTGPVPRKRLTKRKRVDKERGFSRRTGPASITARGHMIQGTRIRCGTILPWPTRCHVLPPRLQGES
jgi:hypothetical protein